MKIATLNLRHNQDRWADRFPLVVDTLHEADADVVGLQEVWLEIRQAHLIAEALNQRVPDRPYEVCVEPKWGPQPEEGIALLSRLPVLERGRLDLPEGERVAQRIAVTKDGTRLDIANTHLHHRPIGDESIRLPQMQALLDWMAAIHPARWLLMGDLNTLPDSATTAAACARLDSAYFSVHGEHPITFPTPLVADQRPGVAICLDYIYFDPASLRVTDARVIAHQSSPADPTLYPSDHFGLAAEVEVIG